MGRIGGYQAYASSFEIPASFDREVMAILERRKMPAEAVEVLRWETASVSQIEGNCERETALLLPASGYPSCVVVPSPRSFLLHSLWG